MFPMSRHISYLVARKTSRRHQTSRHQSSRHQSSRHPPPDVPGGGPPPILPGGVMPLVLPGGVLLPVRPGGVLPPVWPGGVLRPPISMGAHRPPHQYQHYAPYPRRGRGRGRQFPVPVRRKPGNVFCTQVNCIKLPYSLQFAGTTLRTLLIASTNFSVLVTYWIWLVLILAIFE